MNPVSRVRPGGGGGGRIVGVLDIGTSKVCCLIARVDPRWLSGDARVAPQILGVGHQRSRGVKAGVITDLDEAEQAVRAAVGEAERRADVTLEEVFVAVSCGRLRSQIFAAHADVERGIVTADEIERVMAGGQAYVERDERALIHMNRLGFKLDGVPGGRDPRGLAARKLSVDLHAVTADAPPIRNLLLVLEKCFLSATGLVAAPYASALAVTTPEERRLGVTCIDIGGGTTTFATFADGRFIGTDAVLVGGNGITNDIARALQTPLAQAERIKALYGTVVGAQSDEHEVFTYPLTGGEPGATARTTKARLAQVIRPRVSAMLTHVAERLGRRGAIAGTGDHVVMTGGTAELSGMAEFAANALGRPVRIGNPAQSVQLPQTLQSAAFATVVGLISAGLAGGFEARSEVVSGVASSGYLGRVGQWLREGF